MPETKGTRAETSLEAIRARFSADRYATKTTGIEIEEAGEGRAVCVLRLDDRHKNANGHVMGGVFFTLADFTFAVASNCGDVLTVTTTAQISYLSIPRGNLLRGESILLRDGRHQCFYEIRITDETGALIAVVSMSGMHVSGEMLKAKSGYPENKKGE